MSLLSRLFGGGGGPAKPRHASETYKDFTITPDPAREGPRFRLRARIEKEIAGETKTHVMIRADTFEDEDSAAAASLGKARQMIDEQGDRLFG
jgi:hypothetical protein